MSLTNKVLYDIDQRNDTTPTQKETARKNIGAYEDKTAAGGIPKSDLASDVQSSLGKADSSVQSVTANGQAITKSAAGAIDIPKATDTKWGVVQVISTVEPNRNAIPDSQAILKELSNLSAALRARATFLTEVQWQTQSAQPGDASKIYYVGPKGTGKDQYDMYEWKTGDNVYVLTDESTISLDGYWHGAPDILGEDTVAPFITSIEKKADDTVQYRTCSATVGDLGLPVFMDSGVVTPADPHYMYPTVNESTSYEEVKRLVDAGYRPIFVPDIGSIGNHTRYILTGAVAKGYTPAFVFTALVPDREHTLYFTSEKIRTVICQNADEGEDTWLWKGQVLIPNIPEPNDMNRDVGKVLTVDEGGLLYWGDPAGGNNVEVRAGTNNLHVSSADVNDKTIFTMSADYYHSSGNYAGPYTGPGTVIVDPTTMNLESTNSAYGYRENMTGTSISSSSSYSWNPVYGHSNNITRGQYPYFNFLVLGEDTIRPDMYVVMEFKSDNTLLSTVTIDSDMLIAMKEQGLKIRLPSEANSIHFNLHSDNIEGEGYSNAGYNIYGYAHSSSVVYGKGELAWKDETYLYVDEQVAQREPLLPVRGGSSDVGKTLTVSGANGELGWISHSELPETSGSQYLIGDNGTPKWRDREKLVYRSNSLGYHRVTQEDLDAKFIVLPITWNIPAPGISIDSFLYSLVIDSAGYTAAEGGTGHPLITDVTTLSIGYWNDDNTWRGGLLEDVSGSDLPYGSYGHGSIRRTGVTTCADSSLDLYKLRGPAIRLNLTSNPIVGVGDRISISGTIIGIRIDGGLW